jgi:small subunit ribosomal protein S16
MSLKIRMARGGRRNLPFYRIVVTDSRSPRDGNFIEKVGTYNPLLVNDNENRVTLNKERIQYWLSQGAQPSERVTVFLAKAGLMKMGEIIASPKKSAPKAKAVERVKEKEDKIVKAKEAAEKAKADAAEAARAAAEEAAKPKEEPAAEAAAESAAEAPAEGETPTA